MAKQVEVIVSWSEGKIHNLPTGLQYITVAKFEEDKESWEKEAWSIVLEFITPPAIQGNPSKGFARFLVENAPKERLKKGSSFEMYEGKAKTACVKIL